MAADRLHWTGWAFPAAGVAFLGAVTVLQPSLETNFVVAAALLAVLIAGVVAAVHHAEMVAHWLGEPLGTLVLTLSVVVIEVSLIASLMLSGGKGSPTLARDTVFAVLMLVCNGLVGLCIVLGGLRHREQDFQLQGANAYLGVLVALSSLTLVLPRFTETTPGPVFSTHQLGFVGAVSLGLYLVFLFVQTVRHRDYFLSEIHEEHGGRPSNRLALLSAGLLLVSLVAVVLLAKKFAVSLEAGLDVIGAPKAVAGVVVAALVLAPEGASALRATMRDHLQTSLNLALGSAIATIGLSIPALAVVSAVTGQPLTLGLEGRDDILLAVTFLVGILTFSMGRTNILHGFTHLVVFATYLFLVMFP